MKRLMFAGLSALILNSVVVSATFASESVAGANFAESYTAQFDAREQTIEEKAGAKPPSGDSNPSDRHNSTVDGRDIINPQRKSGGKPPSGDSNPSDRHNTTVDTRDIIAPQS